MKDQKSPLSIVNSSGKNVLEDLRSIDSRSYRSDIQNIKAIDLNPFNDWLDLKLYSPENADSVVLLLRYKNTLMMCYESVVGMKPV